MNRFTPLALILIFFLTLPLYAQTDADQIQTAREASNKAIRDYDTEKLLSFLTENVFITTGAGTLIQGKNNLRNYVNHLEGPKMYWVRTPNEIEVNSERGLAWESGTWKGYTENSGDKPVVGGKYSTMWTKDSGTWLIKSQLFVTLD